MASGFQLIQSHESDSILRRLIKSQTQSDSTDCRNYRIYVLNCPRGFSKQPKIGMSIFSFFLRMGCSSICPHSHLYIRVACPTKWLEQPAPLPSSAAPLFFSFEIATALVCVCVCVCVCTFAWWFAPVLDHAALSDGSSADPVHSGALHTVVMHQPTSN